MHKEADDDDTSQLCQRTGGGHFSRDLVRGVKSPEKGKSGQQQDNDYNCCPGNGHEWSGMGELLNKLRRAVRPGLVQSFKQSLPGKWKKRVRGFGDFGDYVVLQFL